VAETGVQGPYRRCVCKGRSGQWDGVCPRCAGTVYADWEWELISAGTESEPVNITAYRNGGLIEVKSVREDSISTKVNTNDSTKVDVSFEFQCSSSMAIGYIPLVDYFSTDA